MSTGIYYPQDALIGFGKALSNRLNINVRFDSGQPRTDGETIYLPEITGTLNQRGFDAVCGVALHEAAHVYFESAPVHKHFATTKLRAACMNAVLDVADETRMEFFIPSAKRMFEAANEDSARNIAAKRLIENGDPTFACLSLGILMNRPGGYRHDLYKQYKNSPHSQKMTQCRRILKKARTIATFGKGPKRYRTNQNWQKLRELAESLVKVLEDFGEDSGGAMGEGQGEGNGACGGQMGPVGSDPSGQAKGGAVPNGGTVAGQSGGEANALSSSAPQPGSQPGQQQGQDQDGDDANTPELVPGGNMKGQGGSTAFFDGNVYTSIRPALVGPMERIAQTDEADGLEDGYGSGPRLGSRIERAYTDGLPFVRRKAEGEKLNVCILLDVSGSMEKVIRKVAGVAQAFADAVSGVANSMFLAVFDDDVKPVRTFKEIRYCNGGTSTEVALRAVDKHFASLSGKKVLVVITDGCPHDTNACIQQANLLRSHNVKTIGIAYSFPPTAIAQSLPGAFIVSAQNPGELACQMGRIAGQVR